MNAKTVVEICVIMENVKIPMDLTSASVHLVIFLIQRAIFVLVSLISLYKSTNYCAL